MLENVLEESALGEMLMGCKCTFLANDTDLQNLAYGSCFNQMLCYSLHFLGPAAPSSGPGDVHEDPWAGPVTNRGNPWPGTGPGLGSWWQPFGPSTSPPGPLYGQLLDDPKYRITFKNAVQS